MIQKKFQWTQGRADLMIALIAMAWGSSYILMKIGLTGIPPFCLIAFRFGIAFLLTALLFRKQVKQISRRTLSRGAILGCILFSVFGLLMYGLRTTSASTAGFLTSMAVVFVPVLQAIINKKKIAFITLLCVIVTVIGIGLMTISESLHFGYGSLLCIGGAFMYAIGLFENRMAYSWGFSSLVLLVSLGLYLLFSLRNQLCPQMPHNGGPYSDSL